MAGFNLICCVVNTGDASKTLKFAQKYGIENGIISIGRGTVKNRFLQFLRVDEIRKEIVTMFVKNELAAKAIKGISEYMKFDKPHQGIAFSYSVSEFIDSKNKTNDNAKIEVKNNMYNVIYVIVDKGKAEDVIDAANKAGAKGGTIINARGAGTPEVRKVFSLEIEPEKEEVFIITKTAAKDKIVAAIRNQLKIDEPGQGVMFVLNINEAYGLQG